MFPLVRLHSPDSTLLTFPVAEASERLEGLTVEKLHGMIKDQGLSQLWPTGYTVLLYPFLQLLVSTI